MDFSGVIAQITPMLILGVIGIMALIVLLLPLSLRFAGLSGQQVVDVLNQTMQFFIALVREIRMSNSDK